MQAALLTLQPRKSTFEGGVNRDVNIVIFNGATNFTGTEAVPPHRETD